MTTTVAQTVFSAPGGGTSGAEFQVGPPSEWAEYRAIPEMAWPQDDPIAMPLVDRQIHLVSGETFTRTVKRLNNGQGVQHGSCVEITYDPSAEAVTVHSVAVIRDGQRREMCHAGAFRVLQREANLDQHILDGHLTAMMFLEDVRVGDLIDVSYTVLETRTAFPGKFSTGQYVRFPVEVGEMNLSIRCESERELQAFCTDKAVSGSVFERDGERIYHWHVDCPDRIRVPLGVPVWHSLGPILWVSDFVSWGEVAVMTMRSWGQVWSNDVVDAEMEQFIESFKGTGRDEEEVADEVIRFVQNEIRYLSLEEGIGCFIPQHPAKVLARRFGDCKDKSLLLTYLLNRLGIAARPVLVSASSQHMVREMLPSPRSFDHVIVMFCIGKGRYYVDPTIRDQGGDLRTRVLPQFGVGLVVDEGTTDLMNLPVPRPDAGEMFIHEEFTFGKESEPVSLKVTTMAKGMDADFLRQQLEAVNRDHLEREIESRYRQFYKDLRPAGGVDFHDDPVRNVLRIIHRFRIRNLGPTPAGGGRRVFHFPAHAVEGRLMGCSDHSREAPISIAYPNKVTQKITATFRNRPKVAKIENLSVEDESFHFSVNTASEGKSAEAVFVYENLMDHVPAERLSEYMDRLNQVFDLMGFNVPAGSEWGFNGPTLKKAAAIAIGLGIVGAVIMGGGHYSARDAAEAGLADGAGAKKGSARVIESINSTYRKYVRGEKEPVVRDEGARIDAQAPAMGLGTAGKTSEGADGEAGDRWEVAPVTETGELSVDF